MAHQQPSSSCPRGDHDLTCPTSRRRRKVSVSWFSTSLPVFCSLLWALAVVIPAVAASSACSYNSAHTLANCSARRLSFVPWGLHKNILTLDLSTNFLPVLANQSFISYPFIGQLMLRNNSIQQIEDRAFQRLSNLRVLDLSNNLLAGVPATPLRTVSTSLVQLVLSGNKIYTVPSGAFSQLVNLKHLDLSGNSIFNIDHGAFANLRAMEVFKIHRNALKSLPHDAFDAFPAERVSQVQLYDNRWFCDCRMRWLRRWINATDAGVWDTSGYPVRCDGPAIVREKLFATLPMDELACEVQMKTSSSTRELAEGANVTLVCKYSSVPEAEARWLLNAEIIDPASQPLKYSIDSQAVEGYSGEKTQISELKIRNFRYEDIARYECFVQNIRGVGSTQYRLTLEGVDFGVVTPAPSNGEHHDKAGVDTRSVVIAVAVVSGIVLLIVIGVLIFCSVNRMQRKKQKKQDAIVENVKQHFINNSEVVSNKDLDASKLGSGKMEDQVDGGHEEDHCSASDHTNDSNLTALKRPLDLDESEPLYIFEQPGSPFNNGNTYVSFGSEITDPGDEYTPPPPLPVANHAPPHHGYPPRQPSSRYESSHAGSATPLLDRYTPSVFDSDEPVEDYAQYPVYDSLTNSLQHPHHHSSNNYSHNPNHQHHNNIYSQAGDGNSAFHSLATSAPPLRNESVSSYSSGERGGGRGEPAKRLSSFHYPPSVNGSMPRTPGSTRSTLALAPRYAMSENPYSIEGSPRAGTADIYGYHRPVPNTIDYRDYRDMRYPGATPPPPPHRITPGKKSMSVGNLGYSPLATGPAPPQPTNTGPRKPPRLFQSREYMELTPQDSGAGGDYITSPEAHQYSQSYGITPGTPV
ncbi:uncharacterized protein LOC101856934 [Aplysia californica]|uniref:Uncharacterized protein LOC101856934 n=1 Tax=Aplysia californica TaxID=6500 RepID=A0ABM0K6U3_APLCA|nr:uncharacterized protein LOC101856934 [Aplysia californica]